METTKLKDYTSIDIDQFLVAESSVINEYQQTDALAFDQLYEGVPGGNIIFGGMQIRKKMYADTTTPGIWIGVDSDGVAKMNLGDASNFFLWNGTDLVISGEITAIGGVIGGWTISATALTGSGAGILQTAATGFRLKMTGVDNAYQFLSNDTLLAELVAEITPNSGTAGATLRHPTDNAWVSVSGSAGSGWSELAGSGGYFAVSSDVSSSVAVTNLDTFFQTNINLKETGAGSDYITIQAPATIAAAYTLTLPTTDGNSGEYLQTNGSGVLTWATVSGGANTALSNLASVAINTDLISDSNLVDDLGSSSIYWDNLYVGAVRLNTSVAEIRYGSTLALDFYTDHLRLGSSYDDLSPASALGANFGDTFRWNLARVDTINANSGTFNGDINMGGNDLNSVQSVGDSGDNRIWFDLAGRIESDNHFDPEGAGSQNLGGSTRYWGDVSYKTLTDRGCLGWYDDGVELLDGQKVSDLTALKAIKPHPTLKTPAGAQRLDYRTLPKHVYTEPKNHRGEVLPKDEDGNYYEEEVDKRTGEIIRRHAQEGAETTALISILLGSIKELSSEVEEIKKQLPVGGGRVK